MLGIVHAHGEELAEAYLPILKEHGVDATPEYAARAISVIKDRASFVADFWTAAPYLFVAPSAYTDKDVAKFWVPEAVEPLKKVRDLISDYSGKMEPASIAEAIEGYIKQNEWPIGKVMNCLRLALTGSASGLGIAEIIYTIGTAEAAARIDRAFAVLNK